MVKSCINHQVKCKHTSSRRLDLREPWRWEDVPQSNHNPRVNSSHSNIYGKRRQFLNCRKQVLHYSQTDNNQHVRRGAVRKGTTSIGIISSALELRQPETTATQTESWQISASLRLGIATTTQATTPFVSDSVSGDRQARHPLGWDYFHPKSATVKLIKMLSILRPSTYKAPLASLDNGEIIVITNLSAQLQSVTLSCLLWRHCLPALPPSLHPASLPFPPCFPPAVHTSDRPTDPIPHLFLCFCVFLYTCFAIPNPHMCLYCTLTFLLPHVKRSFSNWLYSCTDFIPHFSVSYSEPLPIMQLLPYTIFAVL